MRWIVSMALIVSVAGVAGGQTTTYDLVVANGRVIDPASGLDAVRNIGITGGRIAAVSDKPLKGKRVIDAKNHVVAPGLHRPARARPAGRVLPHDGSRRRHHRARAGGRHRRHREILRGRDSRPDRQLRRGCRPHRRAHESARRPEHGHSPRWRRWDREGDRGAGRRDGGDAAKGSRGGCGCGRLGSAYTPGASMDEIQRMFKVAAQGNASAHIHMRNGSPGLDSTIAAAKAAGAKLHIVHVNSSGDTNLPRSSRTSRRRATAGRT